MTLTSPYDPKCPVRTVVFNSERNSDLKTIGRGADAAFDHYVPPPKVRGAY